MGFDVIVAEEIRREIVTSRTRLDAIKTAVDQYGGVTNSLNTRLSGSWANSVKSGASRALSYLDAKISTRANGAYYTSARAAKLDNLNASMTSRAAQVTVNDIRTRAIDTQSKANAIKAQTDKITAMATSVASIKTSTDKLPKAPTGGDAWLREVSPGSATAYTLEVYGAGILRYLQGGGYRSDFKFKLMVDGNWITPVIDSTSTRSGFREFSGNLAAGGIRFNQHFKVYTYQTSVWQSFLYAYTLGD